MHGLVVSMLTQNPILTLFVVIGLGYVLGKTRLFGFRFGVATVLFIGLAVGSLALDFRPGNDSHAGADHLYLHH